MRARSIVVAVFVVGGCAAQGSAPETGPASPEAAVRPLSLDTVLRPDELAELGRAIGDRRIVLLGENGHGVAEFTTLKAGLVRYLHEHHGFDVLAVESGFYECDAVNGAILTLTPTDAIRRCMAYAFEHAELVPLFEYVTAARASSRPLTISGIDLQTQGADTRTRPRYLREQLTTVAPALADRVASLDSALLERTAAGADSLARWVQTEGRHARAAFDTAAARAGGSLRWTLETMRALLDRLLARQDAAVAGDSTPLRFYELRDEWMARTVSWLADSGGRRRKVIVWLHNDHARYGSWATPAGAARATGARLRERYAGSVYAVGFFMGSGSVANNSRQTRQMIAQPEGGIEALMSRTSAAASYLLLSAGALPAARRWGEARRPYLRNGLGLDSMAVGREFDALIFVNRVTPANFRLP